MDTDRVVADENVAQIEVAQDEGYWCVVSVEERETAYM
jgi:hypothetical protein